MDFSGTAPVCYAAFTDRPSCGSESAPYTSGASGVANQPLPLLIGILRFVRECLPIGCQMGRPPGADTTSPRPKPSQ
jgi:hypothetical protein